MSIPATEGNAVTLVEVMPDGNTGVYPQAEVYAPGGAVPLATVDLSHQAKGRYEGSWTPPSVGSFAVVFIVYADAGHAVEHIVYSRESEQIFVTSSSVDDIAADMLRLLGLNLENSFIDNTDYDANEMLLEGRLRIFDSKASLDAASEGGIGEAGTIAEFTVDSQHFGPNRLRWMKMGKL